MKTIHYLYRKEHEEFVLELEAENTSQEILFHCFESSEELLEIDFDAVSHIIVTGSLSTIKQMMEFSKNHNISMGIVPLAEQTKLVKIFHLPKKKKDAFMMALNPCDKLIDMFYCDDIPVLSDVRIGNTTVLKEFEYEYASEPLLKRMALFWSAWRRDKALRHYKYSVSTDDDTKTISAIGMIAIDYDNQSWISSTLKRHLGGKDGQHILAILSPTSLFQYFVMQPLSIFWSKSGKKLPKAIGYIKSNRVEIDCDESVEVTIDDEQSLQTPVVLHSEEKTLSLRVGEKFWQEHTAVKSTKNSIRLDNIPKDEESIKYLSAGLPLFEHASKERYKSLFATLREEAVVGSPFVVMLVLATMIATFGLFINSASVIIGAMLIAPLMQPIVSLGMGTLRQDESLQINSIKTIAIGVLLVLLTAMLIALAVPIEVLTTEMQGRLSPSILDLFVAIVSGIAAAYAKNNEKILGSLAGVSIAVALVPPIAVAGIGIGWAEWGMFGSAFLLFVTNLVGIVFAVVVTFMVLGFSPLHIAKRGMIIWLLIMAVVAIPLYNSFGKMQQNARVQSILAHKILHISDKTVTLEHIKLILHTSKPEIRCEVISNGTLNIAEKQELKEAISKSIDKDIDVIVTFRYVL